MKINLACGTRPIEGYEGVDILDFGQKYVMDAFKFLKSRRKPLEAIAMSHFLEHQDIDGAKELLNLCHKSLTEGGELYITVPHKDKDGAWVLSHKSFYTETTFSVLANDEFCERYGFSKWKIKKMVTNNRKDIHCWLEKI